MKCLLLYLFLSPSFLFRGGV